MRPLFLSFAAAAAVALVAAGCGKSQAPQATATPAAAPTVAAETVVDEHSYAQPDKVRITDIALDLAIDFDKKEISGSATYTLDWVDQKATALVLDTRDLHIDKAEGQRADGSWAPLQFQLAAPDKTLGSALTIQTPERPAKVRVTYATSPEASGLQWLAPSMTEGGKQPFMFSQSQQIHARSWVPLQDTPQVRFTYSAHVTAPKDAMVLMSADNDPNAARDGDYSFKMPQKIPSYLLAIAAGDLVFKPISARSGVWAEPAMVDKAAKEFEDTEKMIETAEQIYGPYRWGRYDLLVLPPSFPYGGMENPRLTFLTPALLAGDRSLVNVVAHELAHSWTGNLVTNANAEHFWLNEGFTVWAERHILEALEGPQLAGLHAAIGFKELQGAFQRFEKRPQLTRLRTQLSGVDPDEAFSLVPYEKGYLFLKTLEAAAGKERFEAMLKRWLHERRFGVATTDDFLAHVEAQLPGVLAQARAAEWVDAPGLPDNHPTPRSTRLDAVTALVGKVPEPAQVAHWTPAEWQLFLDAFPRPASAEVCRTLDERFTLAHAKNPEVKVAFLTLACESGLGQPYAGPVEEVVSHLGRMKYLRPLYQALAGHPETKAGAKALFEKCRAGYHPIAQHVIAQLLAKA